MKNIKLLRGDCLELMKSIPDKSIDLVLTDPPYGTTACKWDSVIPFEPMWAELKRIRKENSTVVLFGSEPFSSYLRMSNIKEFKYDWIWFKNVQRGISLSKTQPMRSHEVIHCFYSKAGKYNKQPTKPRHGCKVGGSSGRKQNSGSDHHPNMKPLPQHFYKDNCNPRSVLEFDVVPNCRGTFHPTQKPVPLLEYLIKTYTDEGDTVLDFTMGSGSTGVACRNLNRKFIGIEKDLTYYDIAMKRIYEALVTKG